MNDTVYVRLRELLDTLPNGYPATESGIEIKILKKIFTPEEAEIFMQLRLKWETPEAIAARSGMDAAYLARKLPEMLNNGQLAGVTIGTVQLFKLIPFIIGIYEYQLNRMDDEFVRLTSEYMDTVYAKEMGSFDPPFMRVIPVESDIPSGAVIEPYESLKHQIESAKAWAVGDCICKKEKKMLGHGCDKPMEVCISFAPLENFFQDYFWGRPITKNEAFSILEMSEKAGLVHMTNNLKNGQYMVCNCCECCCGMLRGLNKFGLEGAVSPSRYVAVVDESLCSGCGICAERCQVRAVDMEDLAAINGRCIGCGLCVSTCPGGAISLTMRESAPVVPENEKQWLKDRDNARGGSGEYKKLIG